MYECEFSSQIFLNFPSIPGDILEQFLSPPVYFHPRKRQQAPSFREEAGTVGGGIISLTTSSSPTNVMFTFRSLVAFLAVFACF